MTFTLQQTAAQVEQRIRTRRTLKLDVSWENQLVFPSYDGLSLRNISHSMAELLGVELPNKAPLDEAVWGDDKPTAVNRIVAYLTDGFGYLYLRELLESDSELRDIIAEITEGRGPVPLTSVTPSTTAVALPTLWSGASPAATGMLGSLMFVREFAQMTDMLAYGPVGAYSNPALGNFDKRMPAESFMPARGLSEWLTDAGVPTHVLAHYSLMGGGLSRILHRGVQHAHSHLGFADTWTRFADVLALTAGKKAYIAVYHPGVDALSHAYGATSRYVHDEIKAQFRALRDLFRLDVARDGNTLFMIMADHGHANATQKIDLRNDPKAAPIRDALRVGPGGDTRLTYLYLREGTRQKVKDTLDQHFADVLAYVDSEVALEAGLFGTEAVAPETPARIGELLLIPKPVVEVTDPQMLELKMVSVHAGLYEREMLIPLMWKQQ